MRAMIKVKAAILSIAMLQMITSGLTPGLSALAEAFPDRSALEIQLTVSCIGVIVLLMSLITDRIYAALTRRRSVILALGMMAAVGLAAWLYHPSLEMMYVYSGLLGLALALYIPAVGSVIIDCFQGEERAKLTGSQSSFCSLGGIVISFVGGMLAAVHWFSVYLVFLLVLPALFLTILYFPKDPKKKMAEFSKGEGGTGKEKRRVSGDILLYGGVCLAFVAIYSACGNNLSMFVAEEGMGSTVLSGALGSIGMAGGVAGRLLFGRFLSRYRERLFPAGTDSVCDDALLSADSLREGSGVAGCSGFVCDLRGSAQSFGRFIAPGHYEPVGAAFCRQRPRALCHCGSAGGGYGGGYNPDGNKAERLRKK